MLKRTTLILASLTLALAVSVPPASSADYVYGTYLPPKHSAVRTLPPVFKALKEESNGELNWRVISGGQLFGGRASIDGAGKGLADGSVMILPYFRKTVPNAFVMSDLFAFGNNATAVFAASAETMMLTCEECREDFKKHNTIWLAGLGGPAQMLMCTKPVTKMSDFKGVKIRTTGATGRIAKFLGAVPVGMVSSEIYTGLQRRQIDCAFGGPAWLVSHRLVESVTHIYNYPFALVRGLATLIMNRDKWNALSTKNKRLMLKYSPRIAAAVHVRGYLADAKRGWAAATKKKVVVTKPEKALRDKMATFRSMEMAIALKNAKKRGVKNPQKIIDAHLAAVAKWEKIIGGKPVTEKGLADLLWKHIYSKVDPGKI